MTPQLKQEYCLEQHSQIVADLAQQCADDAITQEELKSAGNEALLSTFNKLKSENKLLIGDNGAILVSAPSSHRGYNYFSGYVRINIHRAMENAVFERKYHTLVPIRYVEFINKFTRENNDHPTPKEMAEALQCSEKRAQDIISLIQAPDSIESVVDSDGSTLQDTIHDPNAEDPMDTLLSKDRKRFLKHFLIASWVRAKPRFCKSAMALILTNAAHWKKWDGSLMSPANAFARLKRKHCAKYAIRAAKKNSFCPGQ